MRALYWAALVSATGWANAADAPKRDAAAIERAVALQVFLDRANFGPGKIDGHYGDFTKKAAERYRRAKGGGEPGAIATPTRKEDGASSSTAATSTASPTAPTNSRESNRDTEPTATPAAVGLPEPAPQSLPPSDNSKAGADAKPKQAKSANDSEPKEPNRSEAAPADSYADLDLKSIGPVFVDYTVTEADVEAVGEVPQKPEGKAKLKWLPYGSVAEAVAERFHMDLDFLEELNEGKTKNLRAGDVVRVPNVEPFVLASVKDMKPGTPLNAKGANAEDPDGERTGEEKEKDRKTATSEKKAQKEGDDDRAEKEAEKSGGSAAAMSVVVSKDENMLEVFESEKLVAAFPVTVGSSETASPVGEWKVRGVAKLPEFRWDEKMLKEGERSSEFHMLPPGPNSPVGVMWIALNKKGVGIHGSDNPDDIGRNVSHGCIRLANWDVLKLATMVKAGVPVTIR